MIVTGTAKTVRTIVIDPEKSECIKNSENDLSHVSHNFLLLDEATKEPSEYEGSYKEKTGPEGAWDNNQIFVFEDSKHDSTCKDIQTAVAQAFTDGKLLNLDTDVIWILLMKGNSQKQHRYVLLAHSLSGESPMPNVRFGRGKLSEHTREDIKMFASSKVQSPLKHKFNKDDVESSPTHTFQKCHCAGSQDGAHSTSFRPVRRQLCIKNAEMVYGMWNMKKAGSFDISISDSYSCSESLDSSYVDNHTEKFSEDLSEVDSTSHTGYSLSTSSMTSHSLYNLTCTEKPFTEIQTDLGMGEAKFMSVSGSLKGSELPIECCEKEQSIKSRNQLQASMIRDLSELWAPSADFQNQAEADHDGLGAKDVRCLLDAGNMKSMVMKQSTSGKLYRNTDIKEEYATKMLTLGAEVGDAGEDLALKSIFPSAVMEKKTECDNDSKKMQPQALL